MTVEVLNKQKFLRVSKSKICRIVNSVLRGENVQGSSVTILLTGDQGIRRLHRRYLGKDSATDVMAFNPGSRKTKYLGDVIVSAETAKRVAKRYGQTPLKECERYVVHGVLHLLGWRDHSSQAKRRMHKRQEGYL